MGTDPVLEFLLGRLQSAPAEISVYLLVTKIKISSTDGKNMVVQHSRFELRPTYVSCEPLKLPFHSLSPRPEHVKGLRRLREYHGAQ